MNVDVYPESFNVYDSLAGAYFLTGNYTMVETNYRKSLELHPGNKNVQKMPEMIKNKLQSLIQPTPALL